MLSGGYKIGPQARNRLKIKSCWESLKSWKNWQPDSFSYTRPGPGNNKLTLSWLDVQFPLHTATHADTHIYIPKILSTDPKLDSSQHLSKQKKEILVQNHVISADFSSFPRDFMQNWAVKMMPRDAIAMWWRYNTAAILSKEDNFVLQDQSKFSVMCKLNFWQTQKPLWFNFDLLLTLYIKNNRL